MNRFVISPIPLATESTDGGGIVYLTPGRLIFSFVSILKGTVDKGEEF